MFLKHIARVSAFPAAYEGNRARPTRGYVASGTCDGKTLYECVDCSSSLPEYLYYYAPFTNWNIGNIGCGSKYALLYTNTASDDPWMRNREL